MASTFRPIRTVERRRELATALDASPLRPRVERIAAALGATPNVDETTATLDEPGRWVPVQHRLSHGEDGRTRLSSVATTTILHRVAQFLFVLASLPVAFGGLFYIARVHPAALSGRGFLLAVFAVVLTPSLVHYLHHAFLGVWLGRRQARVAELFDEPAALATGYRVATVMPAEEDAESDNAGLTQRRGER